MKAIVTVGCSGSGKSTFAEDLCEIKQTPKGFESSGWCELNRDTARFYLYAHCDGTRDWGAYKFTKAREKEVTTVIDTTLSMAVKDGFNIICSDTNLNPKTRNAMIKKLTDLGYEVEIKDFPCDLQTLYKRNAQRFGGISNDIVYKQYLQWLDYTKARKYVPNVSLPLAVVFDVDGTLAKMNGRGPFDWMRVDEDLYRRDICDMLEGYSDRGYNIVIATGRDGICEALTQHWLECGSLFYEDFYIRPEGNTEKDFVIKERMLWEMEKKWNIAAWVDDRPQVSRHLRLLGVNVIQVGDPYLEF